MARLPALIDTFVKIDGRDRATIEHMARVVRERGFIPTTKRGAGSSAMTSAAATNLLLALNGGTSPKDAADAVKRLRQFSAKTNTFRSEEPLRSLCNANGFGEAIECLIEFFPDIAAFYGRDVKHVDEYFFDAFLIKIEIHFGYATIRLSNGFSSKEDIYFSYHLPVDSEYAGKPPFDRRLVVHLSGKTIFALWRCICGDPEKEA